MVEVVVEVPVAEEVEVDIGAEFEVEVEVHVMVHLGVGDVAVSDVEVRSLEEFLMWLSSSLSLSMTSTLLDIVHTFAPRFCCLQLVVPCFPCRRVVVRT